MRSFLSKNRLEPRLKLDNGSFGLIKIFPKKFSPEVWAEVSRKFIDLSRQSKIYEFGQHPHAISFPSLFVHFEKRVRLIFRLKNDGTNSQKLTTLNCWTVNQSENDLNSINSIIWLMYIVHSITRILWNRVDQGHSYLRCCLHSINFIFISRAYYFVNYLPRVGL